MNVKFNFERIVLTIALLVPTVILVCGLMGARVNRTPSHPIGIYWLVDREPSVGDFAQFCIPLNTDQLPKLDTRVKPCTADQRGTSLLKRIEKIDAKNDKYLVLGDHPRSLDSRIFGPLRRSDITGVLMPVWTVQRDNKQ